MQTILYDGSFEGWLCTVFAVYEYRYAEVNICTQESFRGDIFGKARVIGTDKSQADRVWRGLEKRLSLAAQERIRQAFLCELPNAENYLLQYVRHVFGSGAAVEADYSNAAVLWVTQTARKVWREKHRMEAFVRFQRTGDELYYALIAPDYNVLPLIAPHFESRYADQRWLIYDGKRRYGIYYDGEGCAEVAISFAEGVGADGGVAAFYAGDELIWQRLWQAYFNQVNIPARRNLKLHVRHMPRRYWKYLPEKRPMRF